MKIAIVGTAESSVHLAPFDDPAWQVWGLFGRSSLRRADLLFEMHQEPFWLEGEREAIARSAVPVIMREKDAALEQSAAYPFGEVEEFFSKFGRADLWTSSLAYMLALAIYRSTPGDEIGIWGVDMLQDSEYGYQRPTLEYLIGIGRALQIKVIIPEQSALCRSSVVYGVVDRGLQKAVGIDEPFLQARLAKLKRDKDKAVQTMNAAVGTINLVDGAIQDCEAMIDYVRHFERGGVLAKSA